MEFGSKLKHLISDPMTINTPIAEISFFESESILHIKVLEEAEMNLENTQVHFEKINELVANKQYVALVDSSNYNSIDKEAWQYASLLKIVSNRKAVAHYNSCLANTMKTTFFKQVYNTTMPVKIFDSKEAALVWLKTFLKHEDNHTCGLKNLG